MSSEEVFHNIEAKLVGPNKYIIEADEEMVTLIDRSVNNYMKFRMNSRKANKSKGRKHLFKLIKTKSKDIPVFNDDREYMGTIVKEYIQEFLNDSDDILYGIKISCVNLSPVLSDSDDSEEDQFMISGNDSDNNEEDYSEEPDFYEQ